MRQCGPRRRRLSLAAMALTALSHATTARAVADRDPPPAPQLPNIVLITLDTTRADHLGASGWRFARTPNLDALARRGTRFARCDTAAPITLPSHATILTGLLPPHHGVRDNGTFALPARIESVASMLRAAGYDTGAVVSAIVLARRYGLDQGFRIYDDDLGAGYAAGTEVSERQADATTAAALAVLPKLRPPFFLWVHYFDPHEEYRPPARIAEAMTGPHRLYDGEIAYVDEQLGALLGKVAKNADVVVVGDHGEMLGEHGELTHGLLLYEAARRVPLILAGPDVPVGRTVPCLVRTADVTPTILGWARVAAPNSLDGASLLPLPAGTDCQRQSYTESFLPFFSYRWYPQRSMSDGRFFYLRGATPSLYSLANDPSEERDLVAKEPAVAAAWDRRLRDFLSGMGDALDRDIRPEAALSDEHARRLLSLGYLGGGSGGVVDAQLPDPRTMTGLARRLHEATKAAQDGRCADALPELQSIARADPHNSSAMLLAARCLQEAGKYEEALGLFRRASQENPLSALPVANVGGCLLKLERKDEAIQEFRRALAIDATQAESAANLARLLREKGDRAEALSVLDRAIAAGSYAPSVFSERGLVLAESGRLTEALASFREAARRNPTDPAALENAARAAYRLQDYGESARLYEELLRLSQGGGELWKTLGAIYLYNLQDRANSLRAFRQALRFELDVATRAQLERLVEELER